MEKLIDRVSGMRAVTKAAALAFIAALLTALNYFVVGLPTFGMPISAMEQKIQQVARDQRKLDQDEREKQAIANNLNDYRRDKERLEQRLQDALAELPDDKRIDELLHALQDRAIKSGLEIQTIEPQPQTNEGFYARIPIPITVEGAYHEVATFLDAIGRLQRIVNVNNITLEQPRDLKGRVVLNAKFLATTFMFVDPKDSKGPKDGKGAKAPAGAAPRGGK